MISKTEISSQDMQNTNNFRPKNWLKKYRCLVSYTIDFDGMSNEVGKGITPLGAHSAGRYSARVGVDRHLNFLRDLGISATFFVPGYDAECYPETIKRICKAGHEIAAHGYVHEGMTLPPDEEIRRLKLTHTILSNLTGEPPSGWRSPSGQKTSITLPTLSSLGYKYDSSDKDSDEPYFIDLNNGKKIVEIPNNTYSLDDFPFFNFSLTPVSEVLDQWKSEFDARYAEGGFFMLTVHPRAGWGCGTACRAAAIRDLLKYIQSHSGVKFCTLSEITKLVSAEPDEFDKVQYD